MSSRKKGGGKKGSAARTTVRTQAAKAPNEDQGPSPWLAFAVAAWGLAIHFCHLQGDPLLRTPASFPFFGDSLHFLIKAREVVEGAPTPAAALPFHPPFVSWLLAPLWSLFDSPAVISQAAKYLMMVINAATYGGLFLLLRHRLPNAFWLCMLLPLSFGELMLSSVANSEAVYRLLLLALLTLGLHWPVVGGVLHAFAALTRAEHLAILVVVPLVTLFMPNKRRYAGLLVLGALLVLIPATLVNVNSMARYNQTHADELPAPLPLVVPVSFYGPLNFALAQTEEEIYFSRQTLPVAGSGATLEPRHPEHNDVILNGYAIGWQAITDDPQRFLERSWRKIGHSLNAFLYGYTWRNLPMSPMMVRRPVDMAHAAPGYFWPAFLLLLAGAGLWYLRDHRWLLIAGLLLIAYRLAINTVFFPYLRSMMIAAPFVVLVLGSGVVALAGRHGRKVLMVLVLGLGAYHLATGWQTRDYRIQGERDASGAIIDDRTVEIKWDGFRE